MDEGEERIPDREVRLLGEMSKNCMLLVVCDSHGAQDCLELYVLHTSHEFVAILLSQPPEAGIIDVK